MKPLACLCLVLAAGPSLVAGFPSVPKEVWALRDDPALVAQGAVIVERKLDFQPMHFDQTVRIRILSPAGQAAAELPDLPENLLFLEGQVTYPDGRVQAIGKRQDLLKKTILFPRDGTRMEGVLLPPGLTADCVVDLFWREATARGRANQLRLPLKDFGVLPDRFGTFWYTSLGSAFPTRTVTVLRSRDLFWPFAVMGEGFAMQRGSTSQGDTFTFRDLPAAPQGPYSAEMNRPCPKVMSYKPLQGAEHLDKAPLAAYWAKVADMQQRNWFMNLFTKASAYAAFTKEVRKDLKGGPRERARTIAERIRARIKNLDQLLPDEKPPAGTRQLVDNGLGTSDLDYAVRIGFTDNTGHVRLLFQLLLEEGLQPKVALVGDRRFWTPDPETRTPYQFSGRLLVVDEPGQESLWIDPVDRLAPLGEIPFFHEGTQAVVFSSADWRPDFRVVPVTEAKANARSFTYEIDASGEAGSVSATRTSSGIPALHARRDLAFLAPAAQEAWVRERMERPGFTVAKAEVDHAADPSRPLGIRVKGTLALDRAKGLTLDPFPGLDAGMYLPETLPPQRLDPILMPWLGVQEAVSIIRVPKGYRLPEPLLSGCSNRWGSVVMRASQDPASGDVRVEMKYVLASRMELADGYEEFGEFLRAVRAAVSSRITLEGPK